MGIVPATRRLGRKTHCRESVGQRLPRSKISLCRPIRVATETGVCRDESERRKDNFRVDRDSRAIQKIRSPSAHLEHSLSDQAISHQVKMWQCIFLAPRAAATWPLIDPRNAEPTGAQLYRWRRRSTRALRAASINPVIARARSKTDRPGGGAWDSPCERALPLVGASGFSDIPRLRFTSSASGWGTLGVVHEGTIPCAAPAWDRAAMHSTPAAGTQARQPRAAQH
jgi:hypothetical protein